MPTLNPDGPHSPENTRKVADTAAECIRVLNYASAVSHAPEALEFPSDVDSILASLATMAQRLPQLLEQLTGWLTGEDSEGLLAVTHGPYAGVPGMAVSQAEIWLDSAREAAGELYEALDAARQVTATISAASSREDEDG